MAERNIYQIAAIVLNHVGDALKMAATELHDSTRTEKEDAEDNLTPTDDVGGKEDAPDKAVFQARKRPWTF